MKKIFTDKFIIFFKNKDSLSEIDIPTLTFLIDDCYNIDITSIIPEDILTFTTICNDMSIIKYNVSLLIKYLLSTHNFRDNKKLCNAINNINNTSVPFLGYFTFLYENIVKVERKYVRENHDLIYIYLSDLNYLD
tara:strand:+ start:2566 stop:2970 length:405 start_codon:yes stop_codon:yes gene_type:complete